MHTIRQITSTETFSVRHPVLRPGKPLETCIFEGDDLETTVHFGIYDKAELVGVISVFEAASPAFGEEKQSQIRGMAVLDSQQGKGLGAQLVQQAEQYVLDKGGKFIWFNAREIAVAFYERVGYKKSGGPFPIGDIGPHYIMYKLLN